MDVVLAASLATVFGVPIAQIYEMEAMSELFSCSIDYLLGRV